MKIEIKRYFTPQFIKLQKYDSNYKIIKIGIFNCYYYY